MSCRDCYVFIVEMHYPGEGMEEFLTWFIDVRSEDASYTECGQVLAFYGNVPDSIPWYWETVLRYWRRA